MTKAANSADGLRSGTYGKNDPLTLKWVAALLNAERPNCIDQKGTWLNTQNLRDGLAQKNLSPFEKTTATTNSEFKCSAFAWLCFVQFTRTAGLEVKQVVDLHNYFISELQGQIGQRDIQNSSFDIGHLVFSLEGALLTDERYCDEHLFRRVLEIIETRSKSTSERWRPSNPFIATAQGLTLFPLSVEIAASMLRSWNLVRRRNTNFRDSRFEIFSEYAKWLLDCKIPGKQVGEGGWSSEHTGPEETIHLWYTSQVALFLFDFATTLQHCIADQALENVKLRRTPARDDLAWNDALGEDPPSPYKAIKEKFIDKHAAESTAKHKSWSMLIHGPPGTGKTTLVQSIAYELKWKIIEITPSDLGADPFAARVKL